MKKRLDLHLVDTGLAKSRSQAKQLIEAGHVMIDGNPAAKTSLEVASDAKIEILENDLNRYVSRGGLKLEGALKHARLDVRGLRVLDIGISTGGFADCLLQNGAAQIIGVDVGTQQTAPKIKNDPRVTVFESINARDLNFETIGSAAPFDLVVIDVSFISLSHILPRAKLMLAPEKSPGRILALVKPQFEAGRAALGKSGVIKEPKAFDDVREKIYKICEELALDVEDYFESSITGSDGNQEFFVLARPHRAR